jgi:hypothetical protein
MEEFRSEIFPQLAIIPIESYGAPPGPVISELGSTFYNRPSRIIPMLNLHNNIITFFVSHPLVHI